MAIGDKESVPLIFAQSLLPLKNVARKSKSSAQDIRNEFAEYFSTNGAVPWQNN